MRKTPDSTEMKKGQEIAPEDWKAFFQQFSKDHQEWLVYVSGQADDNTASQQANGLPFQALTLHLDHTEEVLSILVRKDDVAQEHVYMSIPRPSRVGVEKVGTDVKLHIDSSEGSSTTIRFRQVATPDYESEAIGGKSENGGRP
jgi:Family of unknown function (DUF5335)